MASAEHGVSGLLARVAAVALLGVAVSGCSSVPSWVDPTTWLGPDVSSQASADSGGYPDLADTPNRPAAPSTPDERQQVANSLAAAGSNVKYSAQSLRGGTQASAPPPAAAPSSTQIAEEEQAAEGQSKPAPQSQQSAPAPAAPEQQVATAEEPPAQPAPAAAPEAEASSSGQAVGGAQPAMMADTSGGFEPSKAPPLDAAVAQYVPSSVMAEYARTGAVGAQSAASTVTLKRPRGTQVASNGSVRTDMGALGSANAVPSVYTSPSGQRPVAVVMFPDDSAAVGAEGRQAIANAAAAYKAGGDSGYVRVIGHASSRTLNMSLTRHKEINFRKSQARARAVAAQLIADGVPADKVLVDAVGASQPVYYESMPKGEAGNRRAEIYFQG